ncbi:MAG: 3'-5' exonuclease [Rhodocyclaceae bacterium]
MLHLGPLRPARPRHEAVPDWPAEFATRAREARDPRLRRYYARGMVTADTPLCATPLIAIDVETTGLDPQRDGIVSIGIVPMSSERIRASASRHWIVKPRVELAAESVALHGITHSQVADAPDLDAVLDEVLAAVAGHVLVVHCRQIERAFLDDALLKRIGEHIVFPVIDTMELEARLHRSPPKGGWFARLSRRPRISLRLADSRARYGLPRYRPHHAATDALATAELLQAQLAHHFAPDIPVGRLWL